MINPYWLSNAQMARLEPFFPKSHGKPRVDDRRVLSGIILINRNGLPRKDAPRGYGPAKTLYSDYLARNEGDTDDMEGALIEAHVMIAALGLVPDVKETVEAEAEKLATQWLSRYRVEIKRLSDERQDVYRQIREMSSEPMPVDLARPTSWMQPTTLLSCAGR